MTGVYDRGTRHNILTFYNVFAGFANVFNFGLWRDGYLFNRMLNKIQFFERARGYYVVYVGGLGVVFYLTGC